MRHGIAAFLGLLGAVLIAGAIPAGAASPPPLGPDDMILGKADAPVTVIEYASMSCPHCAEFENDTWPQVKSNWIDTGKIKYVFRDFPLDNAALRGALLARCAAPNVQLFYTFVEVLYGSQRSWVLADDPVAELQRLGSLGGIPKARFDACQSDQAMQDKIVNSRKLAEAAGVEATPTFYVNGTKVEGAASYDDLAKALQMAMPTH